MRTARASRLPEVSRLAVISPRRVPALTVPPGASPDLMGGTVARRGVAIGHSSPTTPTAVGVASAVTRPEGVVVGVANVATIDLPRTTRSKPLPPMMSESPGTRNYNHSHQGPLLSQPWTETVKQLIPIQTIHFTMLYSMVYPVLPLPPMMTINV